MVDLPDNSGSESVPSRADGERDRAGRFRPGNRTSRLGGDPNAKRRAEHNRAVRSAASPAQVARAMRHLYKLGLAGDTQALRVWLEHADGKPRPKASATAIELPPLHDAHGINEALRRVAVAVAAGEMDGAEATSVVAALRAVVEGDLLQQLHREIEKLKRLGPPQ